jgi:hypothetical protein
MNNLDNKIQEEKNKIFPFNTYHNYTDWTFYYDLAKKGELTLNMICKIHHMVGATGIQNLIRLYMEFNKIEDKIEDKPKKNIKKVIKKV